MAAQGAAQTTRVLVQCVCQFAQASVAWSTVPGSSSCTTVVPGGGGAGASGVCGGGGGGSAGGSV